MSEKTYYLKYRPQELEELDLEAVRESLTKIVKSKKIPHAFLFSGPKGSGKTSAARILAKIVNCEKRRANSAEPCNKCKQCKSIIKGSNIDVIEMDAASHRGIDDVRALRDAVKLSPAKASKKVYIIDEAHMLTTEASNALLKTLEEPPEHVLFILATTNPEKLIDTIRSRTVNIVFSKATIEEIIRSLGKKIKGEKLKINKESLKLIATASDGSFRDADKILEQLVTENIPLNYEKIKNFIFQRKVFDTDKLIDLLLVQDEKEALLEIDKAVQSGVDIRKYLEQLLQKLRLELLAKVGLGEETLEKIGKKELVQLIKMLSKALEETPSAVIEQLPLEVAVVEWCSTKVSDIDNSNDDIDFSDDPANENNSDEMKVDVGDNDQEEKINQQKRNLLSEVNEEVWSRILSEIRPRNTSTEALLRAAKPIQYDGHTLELGVYYRFHKERLESVQHRQLLEDVAAQILGNNIRILCTLTEQVREERKIAEAKDEDDSVLTETEDADIIKVAKEIFGN